MGKTRYRGTLALAWGSWLTALAGTWLVTTDVIPGQLSMIIIFLIGLGITASLALSRHKLSETITEVFVTGMRISMMTHLTGEQRIQVLDAYAETLPGEPGVSDED